MAFLSSHLTQHQWKFKLHCEAPKRGHKTTYPRSQVWCRYTHTYTNTHHKYTLTSLVLYDTYRRLYKSTYSSHIDTHTHMRKENVLFSVCYKSLCCHDMKSNCEKKWSTEMVLEPFIEEVSLQSLLSCHLSCPVIFKAIAANKHIFKMHAFLMVLSLGSTCADHPTGPLWPSSLICIWCPSTFM